MKIKGLWQKYREYILYVFFGGLTTVVNYIIYFCLTHVAAMEVVAANSISWVASVAFAYITNRIWVFRSRAKGFPKILREILEFALARIVTLVLEDGILWLFADKLGFNDLIVKVAASIVTIVLNYVFSKFIIFKSKSGTKD